MIILLGTFTGTGAVTYFVYRDRSIRDSNIDSQMKRLIKSKLRNHKDITEHVKVYVYNGIVLLLGYTDNKESLEKIINTIKDSRFNLRIKNHIEIRNDIYDDNKNKKSKKGEIKDSEITYMCKSNAAMTKGVKSVNFKVITYNKTVYIMGKYRSKDELIAVTNSLKNIKGVRRIVSYAEPIETDETQ